MCVYIQTYPTRRLSLSLDKKKPTNQSTKTQKNKQKKTPETFANLKLGSFNCNWPHFQA